ncbi:MAG: family 10 glycosylhydrolase [Opitutaceae bacterium]|nr:family 10 glycosylhydrolase [Opitutaceae bacterium]
MRLHQVILTFLVFAAGAVGFAKEKILTLSWGDVIWQHEGQGAAALDTPDKLRESVRTWKDKGVTKVHFRVDDFRILLFHEGARIGGDRYAELAGRTTRAAWEQNLVAVAVEALKREGIEIQAYITIFDEGSPPAVIFGNGVPFPWQSRFTRDHPEFLACDRSPTASGRKYHWGVPEYAYPEVREHMLRMITTFSDAYAFDGVFLSIRTHSAPPEHADQFGFNEPVVREYEKRYGRNILLQDFDLAKWRDLRGEYLTQFLRDVRAHLNAKGQRLAIGIPQGDHLGPPFGNLTLAWRQWVRERLVDEIVVGHISQERARYPRLMQRASGYVQNQEEGLNLPPIEQDVAESYGPLCRQHGVKLYVDPERFGYVYAHPAYGPGRQPPEVHARLKQVLEALPDVAGLTYDYSDILGLKRSND